MTAPTPLDQDDLAARAAAAGVAVEFDADHAYATIGGRVYRARLERVAVEDEGCDCLALCSMGPTCPGGMLAGLPGAGCWRTEEP